MAVKEESGQRSAEEKESEAYSPKAFLCDTADILESIISSMFIVMLIFAFLFCTANVDGDSMLPTLEDGDRLVVSRLDKQYEDGDILIVYSGEAHLLNSAGEVYTSAGLDKRIVKRLIASAGEEINIDFAANTVSVNGVVLDEPYIETQTVDRHAFQYPLTIPEGYVFVMGDNRFISKDSRHPDVGLIPVEDIVGKVVFRVAPLAKIGKVE